MIANILFQLNSLYPHQQRRLVRLHYVSLSCSRPLRRQTCSLHQILQIEISNSVIHHHAPEPGILLLGKKEIVGKLTSIHFLQRLSLRLLDEEPGKNNKRVVKDTEHEKRAPPKILYRVRRDLREDKVKQPLRRGADRNTRLADARGEDLRHVQPRHGAPADVVAHGLEVHHGQRRDARGRQPGAGGRRVRRGQHGDDQHVRAHEKRAKEERAAPPDTLDEEEQEEEA